MTNSPIVGYSDFVRLTGFSAGNNPLGLELRNDAVYLAPLDFDGYLTPGEHATLIEHPTGNPAEPVLRFPCSLAELKEFTEQQGLRGSIDPFDLADFARAKADEVETTTPSKPKATRTEHTLYRIIGSLAQGLAEVAHTDRVPLMKDGKAFAGGGVKCSGVAGYLLDKGLTGLQKTALQDHIGTALKNYNRRRPKDATGGPEKRS